MQGALAAGAQLAPDGSLAKPATADMADPYAVADMQTAQQQQLQAPLMAEQQPWTHAIAGAAGVGQQFAPGGNLYTPDPTAGLWQQSPVSAMPEQMRPPDMMAAPNIYQGGQGFNPGGYPAPYGRMPLSQFAQGGWTTGQHLLQNQFNAPQARPDVARTLFRPSGVWAY
jgi:hypothetical protein